MPYAPLTHSQRQRKKRGEGRPSACKRGYGRRWERIRQRILQRDHYTCVACGVYVGKGGHVDHIVAKRRGGTDADTNLRTLCEVCHGRKSVEQDGGFGR